MKGTVFLLTVLYLQGCGHSFVQDGLDEVTAPYCIGLLEIQEIEGVWQQEDGALHICAVGIPVGRVADEPRYRERWRDMQYSITIPARVINPPSWIAEPRPGDTVDITANNVSPGCVATFTTGREIPIATYGKTGYMNKTSVSGTPYELSDIAILELYDPRVNASEFQPEPGREQTIILRRTAEGEEPYTYISYRLQRPHGEPPVNMAVWTAGAVVADTLVFVLAGGEDLGDGEHPAACLKN